MPQMFQVIRCFKCTVFQVHQIKKSNKFQCKMCGEKQSIKRHYGVGNGQECRLHVQKLNGIRGELQEDIILSEDETSYVKENDRVTLKNKENEKQSKWLEFVDCDDINNTPIASDSKNFLQDFKTVLELPKMKRPRNSNLNLKKMERISPNKKFKGQTENVQFEPVSLTELSRSNTTLSGVKMNDENRNIGKHSKLKDNIDSSKTTYESHIEFDNNVFECSVYETCAKSMKSNTPQLGHNSKWAKFTHDDDDGETLNDGNVIENENLSSCDTFLSEVEKGSDSKSFGSHINPEIDQMYLGNNTLNYDFKHVSPTMKDVSKPFIGIDRPEMNDSSKWVKLTDNIKDNIQSSENEQCYDNNSSGELLNKSFDSGKITGNRFSNNNCFKSIKINGEKKTLIQNVKNEINKVTLPHTIYKNSELLNSCSNNIQTLFSLCDDSEIDDYLNV